MIQNRLELRNSDSTRSLQVKPDNPERKFLKNKSLDKFKRLHYSLSSDNVLLSRQLGGSQPILNYPINKKRNSHLSNKSVQDPVFLFAERKGSGHRSRDTSQYSHLESEKNRSRGSQNSILNSYSSHSANSYNSDPRYKSSYRGSSKSCEHLLGSHSPFTTLSCDELDNEDIEDEEQFLNEEMKTEWIPKPTRSISLALFQSPEVSTKVFFP